MKTTVDVDTFMGQLLNDWNQQNHKFSHQVDALFDLNYKSGDLERAIQACTICQNASTK